MNSYPHFWILIALAALATYSLRSLFIFSTRFNGEHPLMRRILDQVPTSIMAALVVGGMHLAPATLDQVDPKRLAALFIAAVVAWKTKNLLYTILIGFLALGVLTLVLGLLT